MAQVPNARFAELLCVPLFGSCAKVNYLQNVLLLRVNEHILRLEIAMNDPETMAVSYGLQDLKNDNRRLVLALHPVIDDLIK